MRVKRFTPVQRIFHVLLAFSFVWQSLTGLARLLPESWAGSVAAGLLGGQEGILAAHKAGGVFMVSLFLAHLIHLALSAKRSDLYGPDSMTPRVKDFKDFFAHVGWMLGIGKHPSLDRFAYWEKFDYWAVFWGVAIIGGSGIVLLDPVAAARHMPGWALNIALALHREEAFLAVGYIFLIHFTVAHLRASRFPMDMAMAEGTMPLEEVERERGEWAARLKAAGPSALDSGPGFTGGARSAALAVGWLLVLSGWGLAVWAIAAMTGLA